ncbi:MAG: hypothetical protein PQJ49_10440 [Sphaerochaetaceae bacterium]|nr:hypothetical protein [Sphaerochaetaceae bacterium]
MAIKIKIVTNCCYNCKHKSDDFTDGTFHCEWQDEYFEDEVRDCEFFEMSDDDEEEEEW